MLPKQPRCLGPTAKRSLLFVSLVLVSVLGASIASATADDATTCMRAAPDVAIAACSRIISAAGTSSTHELALVYSFRGLHFQQKKDFDKALADYDRAILLEPNNSVPHGGRGIVYLEKGDYDHAISELSEAIRLAPQNATSSKASDYSFRGDAYTRKHEYGPALHDYNSAITLDPASDAAFGGRGLLYFELGDYDHAIEDLGTAIRLDPNDPGSYLLRGRCYSKKGEYDRAIVDINLAIKLKHPRMAFAFLVRGDAYEGSGDLEKALIDYRTAVDRGLSSDSQGLMREATVGIQRIEKRLAARNATPIAPSAKLQSTGSGFVINVGNILTNYHVIEGCLKIQVRWSSGVKEASIIESDEANDLAVLRAEIDRLKPLPFRDGRAIRLADPIVLIGFPLTGLLATSPKVSTGSVSALAGLGDDTRFLQISAPIQPGNSGGPVLDFSGNAVGVVVSTLNAAAMLKNTGAVPQNVNFAIKSNIVREFLDAKGITYDTVVSAAKFDAADVAERGVRSTVLIECYKEKAAQ